MTQQTQESPEKFETEGNQLGEVVGDYDFDEKIESEFQRSLIFG